MSSRLKHSCLLCGSKTNEPSQFGDVFETKKYTLHHFCLLFSTDCEQRGEDDEGFAGFLKEDIRTAASYARHRRCGVCGRNGANIVCSFKKCCKAFHTKCALKANANFQFCDYFPVYCREHHTIKFKETKKLDGTCGICYEKTDKKKSILIPCCKNSWFHRMCLQKYALTSGYYHFKCPLCADKDTCIKRLPMMGIYLPMRDAMWEIDDDFADMAEPPSVTCEFCDSDEQSEENHLWKMCESCGAAGVHWRCLDAVECQNFTCRQCFEILERKEKLNRSKKKTPRKTRNLNERPNICSMLGEELCSSSDDDEGPRSSHAHPRQSYSSSNGSSSTSSASTSQSQNMDDSDGEIVRPRTFKRRTISDDEDSIESDEEILKPKTFKRRLISDGEESECGSRKENISESEEEMVKPKNFKRRAISDGSSSDSDSSFPPTRRRKTTSRRYKKFIVSSPENSPTIQRFRNRI